MSRQTHEYFDAEDRPIRRPDPIELPTMPTLQPIPREVNPTADPEHRSADPIKVADLKNKQIIWNDISPMSTAASNWSGVGIRVIDESQAIKNAYFQRFKAVQRLRAYNRLALSGTSNRTNWPWPAN